MPPNYEAEASLWLVNEFSTAKSMSRLTLRFPLNWKQSFRRLFNVLTQNFCKGSEDFLNVHTSRQLFCTTMFEAETTTTATFDFFTILFSKCFDNSRSSSRKSFIYSFGNYCWLHILSHAFKMQYGINNTNKRR
jgi:hypothetical protein